MDKNNRISEIAWAVVGFGCMFTMILWGLLTC